jgi:hypothetical protein
MTDDPLSCPIMRTKAGGGRAAEVAAREEFTGCFDEVRASGHVLELDLVADLDELFCDEVLAFIAMERQQY